MDIVPGQPSPERRGRPSALKRASRRFLLSALLAIALFASPVVGFRSAALSIEPRSVAFAHCEAYCSQEADSIAKEDAARAYNNCMESGRSPQECDDLYHSVYNSSYGYWYQNCIDQFH